MVMIKKGDGTTNWSGKMGGTVFRDDQCRQHAQKEPRDINREPSPSQKKRRRAYQYLMQILRRCIFGNLELTFIWTDYAKSKPRTNKKGETIHLSWFQMFISHNINKTVAGELPDLLPPGYELKGSVPAWCELFL